MKPFHQHMHAAVHPATEVRAVSAIFAGLVLATCVTRAPAASAQTEQRILGPGYAELQGIDAVAFRVMTRPYKSCGGGGDPKTCDGAAVRCEMDLYFDHQRNPLPWDERRPARYANHFATSVHFLASYRPESHPNYPVPYQLLKVPERLGEHYFASDSPFMDPASGRGLWWEGGFWNSNQDRGGIYMDLIRYDQEIFTGIAWVVMGGGCGQPPDALWLTADNADYRNKNTAYKQASLPQSWRIRVQQALRESNERAATFFQQQGEKAMKALRELPVPNKAIVPLQ